MKRSVASHVLDRIAKRLPFHKLNSAQVMGVTGGLLGVALFVTFMFSNPPSQLAFFGLLFVSAFIVWCVARGSGHKPRRGS